MKKREQKFGTELGKWLQYYGEKELGKSGPIECKVSIDDKPFNFKSGFKPHQLPGLIKAQGGVVHYKISDMDRMQKPWDIDFYCKAQSFIAIMWIRPKNKTFYLINPITIQGLIDDGIKSLTEPMAAQYADFIGTLK